MPKIHINNKAMQYLISGATLFSTYTHYRKSDETPSSLDHDSTQRNSSFSSAQLSILPKYLFQSPIQPQETIIFMHTPKTGGTNLNFIAMALSIVDAASFSYVRFRAPRHQNKSSIKIDAGWHGAYETAKEKLENSNAKYNFICGHFPFGLHAYSPEAKYVGLVRDPLQRSLSLTNFNFQRGLINNADQAKENLFSELDNPQTRLFAGVEYMDGDCTEETLKKAKTNIKEHFMLIAPIEETETFLAVLSSIQKWKPLAIAKQQITGKKILDKVPDELLEALIKKNELDIKLYSWVKEQWQLWKTLNIDTAITPSDDNSEFLCIMPDFSNTQNPLSMSLKEVKEHNKKVLPGLVNTSQEYSSQNQIPKAKL